MKLLHLLSFVTRTSLCSSTKMPSHNGDLIRSDGLKINYDPYAPEMVAKYGAPGKTDSEGFDPYSDTVGAGIYGGRVKRDEHGEVIIGRQYQVCYESLLYKIISLI